MSSLLATVDPASAMAEFEQILASNSGEDPFDSAVKLLAAKLADERDGDGTVFQVQKTPEATHRAIQSLYKKALESWPELNGNGSNLGISPQHLVRSIRPLVGWRLVGSDLSWLDATLERLVARDAKGALGQYFTPREIVRFCIEVLNPDQKDRILDPACGSGGFLFEATRHCLRESGAAPHCLGIDFGARAIKVAALLAAATPKSKMTVSRANSIDGRAYSNDSPAEWAGFLTRDSGSETTRAQSWGNWNRLGCTVLATNPPFAGDIDELDVLDAYESQRFTSGRNVVSREHLFLERAVDLLRPNGRLAIVLPQGLLANSSALYLRRWLFQRCRILGVVGLHPHSFLPNTSVKTSILFAVKHPNASTILNNHKIFFATSQNCGKDGRGRTVGSNDYHEIAQSFSKFLRSQGFSWARYSAGTGKSGAEIVPQSEVVSADRLDAEYFDTHARELVKKFGASTQVQIANLIDSRPQRFKRGNFKNILYLDISSVDSKTGLTSPTMIPASEAPSRAAYVVQPGDVLVSTVRPDRNVVGLVTDSAEIPTVASNGFCLLRPKSIEPEVLYAYCKTDTFRKLLSRHATASMYPTVTDKDVLSIPFLEPTRETKDRVTKLVRSGIEMLRKGQRALDEAGTLMTSSSNHETKSVIETAASGVHQKRKSYSTKKRKR